MKPNIFDILKKRLKMLYKVRNNISGEDLDIVENSIWILEYILKGKHNKYIKYNDSLELRLNYETKRLSDIKSYNHFLSELSESKLLSYKDYASSNLKSVNIKDLFEFTYDFFEKYTDKDILQYFMMMFNNRDNLIYINKSTDSSYSFFLPYTLEHFIFLQRVGTIEDFPELVHEYGHGIANLFNYNIKSQFPEKKIFIEIVSTFFEMLANNYLKSNPEFSSYQEYMDIVIFNNYVTKSVLLNEECTIIDLWKSVRNSSNPIDTLVREYNILSETSANKEVSEIFDIDIDIESLLDNNLVYEFPYILGYIVSIELLMIYISDKEKGLYTLKQLINIDWRLPNKKYFNEIIKLGLLPNIHLEEYKQYIMRPKGM